MDLNTSVKSQGHTWAAVLNGPQPPAARLLHQHTAAHGHYAVYECDVGCAYVFRPSGKDQFSEA